MQKNKNAIKSLLSGLLLLIIAVQRINAFNTTPASSTSTPTTSTTSTTPTLACSIDVSKMNFGPYDAMNIFPVAASASINVTCLATIVGTQVAYQIKLSPGNGGSYGTRQMTNGANALNYNIYTDLKYQNILGDGTSGTQLIADGYIINQIQNYVKIYTIYGLIPPQQSVPPGTYSDSVTVTVNF